MTSPEPASPPSADWPAQVTERIESVVGTVRDKTTVPALTVARAVVYGILAAALGTALLVFFVIALMRFGDVYIGIGPYGRRVWIVDAIASAIFLGLGAFVWRMRRPRQA